MRVRVETLVVGLGLVWLGVVGLLDNLGKLDAIDTLDRWWPMLLVVWGALEVGLGLGKRRAAAGRT